MIPSRLAEMMTPSPRGAQRRLVFLLLAALVSAATAAAPPAYDPALLATLKWRAVGPIRGGRSTAAAGSARRPLEYYFGATGGGLWKTSDGGTTWTPVSDSFFRTSSVGAVAVSESNPDVVYAGMGETQLRGNVIQGDGVYRSSDGGKTWEHRGLADTRAIARIRVHPANPDVVYAAAFGDPYAPSASRGVFRSRDAGKSWEKVLFRDPRAGAVDLVLDPRDPDVLYASLWEAYRTPHSLSSGGAGSGLFKSTDGGTRWTELSRSPGMPAGLLGKIGIAVSGADSRRVYALVEAAEGGLFASDDAGATWRAVNHERRLWQRAFYFTRVYADPAQRDTVYVLNFELLRSTDGGRTFKEVTAPHADHHDLWIAPDDPRRLINANDGGANVSVNGGHTWTDQDFPTAQLYNAFTTRHVPYHVCGAQQDNTTVCVPSDGNGSVFYAVGGGESGYVAPDPRNADVFYAGSFGGFMTRYDRATGQTRLVNVWPEYPVGQSARDLKERFQWTTPIVFSPLDPRALYVGSQHLWRSTTEGQSWERISPDLTRHDPATLGPSGGPLTLDQTGVETYGTIFTIAPSRRESSALWVGTDDGFVQVTRDGGKTWENVTPRELPPFSRVSLIEASPHRPGGAYVAANRYQLADRAPYVFATDDYGKTWRKITAGLPADDFARAVREDPKRAGLLYLGTEHGIYVSFDDGASWQTLRLNLPVTPVHGLVVEENDLVIGTHGRSFYVLDEIGILRQLAPDAAAEPVRLFRPSGAVRSVSRGSTFDYWLKEQPRRLRLEIFDAGGRAVRAFSEPAEPRPEDAASGVTESSRAPVPRLPAAAGMNRFVWDLRWSHADDFPGLIMYQATTRGPRLPPGSYRVRLTADGQSREETFEIRKDPRLTSVSQADLDEQFRLALVIHEKFSAANRAVTRIRDLKRQISERAGRTQDARVGTAGRTVADRLSAVEREIYQVRNRATKDPLNFAPKLNNKLAVLGTVVDSADARPTDSSYAVFKELSAQLDAQLARLDQITREDVAAFNALLAGLKIDPVK